MDVRVDSLTIKMSRNEMMWMGKKHTCKLVLGIIVVKFADESRYL